MKLMKRNTGVTTFLIPAFVSMGIFVASQSVHRLVVNSASEQPVYLVVV
jgi:hypothetical protein